MFAARDLAALDLPETYLLYHGPRDLPALRRLLNAWSWAADAVGEAFPLVLLGFDDTSRSRLEELLPDAFLEKTLRALPPVSFPWIAEIYRGCAVLFHPSPISPWGNPVRHALACERPVVAAENPLTDALAGPAAYLAPAGDSRTLGAAMVTLVVEEQVSNNLVQAARRRAGTWQSGSFSPALLAAYESIISPS
jgi:glycosyltransferase involved in cell wall biosynthesis